VGTLSAIADTISEQANGNSLFSLQYIRQYSQIWGFTLSMSSPVATQYWQTYFFNFAVPPGLVANQENICQMGSEQ
jgi:hypothetical protein